MKKYLLISGALAALMLPATTSCSEDYLQEEPQTGISDHTVNSSPAGADAAVTGLARQMSRQFSDLKNGNLNASGELFFRNLYGEGLSPDTNVGEITNYANSSTNPANFRLINGWWAKWMYNYAYSIINLANNILGSIPDGELDQNQNWLKANALTFRAHAYYRLMQVYGPRWADSNNGNKYCLVLRLNANEPNEHPFNTCNEVYDQMYKDLKEAIELFKDVPAERAKRGDNLFYADGNVAMGILARMALLKNDYKTAQQMAHDARQGYPLMSANEYLKGFSTTSKAWIWSPAMDPLGTYYWGFGPHYACNGHYVISWGYSSSMDYNLYHKLSVSDVRSKLYFGPLLVDIVPEMAEKYGITKEDFFSDKVTLQTKLGVSLTGTGKSPKGKNLKMWEFIKEYGTSFYSMRPLDIKGIYLTNTKGICLGVQYKFQGLDDGYTSCWPPYMRAEEMLLTEAEAAYMNGDTSTAENCIKELMAVRDENYTLTATGADLLNEIKLQRKIELWGEGFSWFDYKRWNEVIDRKAWDPNDLENCGGWPSTLARSYLIDFMYGWRAAVPRDEFIYNKEADASLIGL